ncbi:ribonuclease P protein subunit p25 [Eurosta solidaginis]|uniref:ribonuclease P protein subunit p25 n=1 Tax=Eurosta solidaginis TaxID=178769 RepID=UPI003530C65B
MMHYRKGENIEQELTKDDLPFEDCLPKLPQKDFLWMHVKGGTKVHNVLNYAKNALDKGEYRTVVWSGSGGGVVKTVSCAEILKRSYPLHQLTRMDQITIEEHWVPQMDGLEPIVAKRKVPSLHILMTLDPIDESIADVQKPNTTTEFWRGLSGDSQQKKQQRRPGANSDGQSHRPRYQQHKQPRQQGERQEEEKVVSTGEQRVRPQNFKKHANRNRGEQRQGQSRNDSEQQQKEGQLQDPSQPDNDVRQDGQQQSQRHRRTKPKQKQQQPRSPQVVHVEGTPASSTTNNPNGMES